MPNFIRLLILLCFTLPLSVRLCSANEIDIKSLAAETSYFTEDYAPGNFKSRSKLVGISVDTLKLIWQTLGVAEQPVSVVPWARGYRTVLNSENTMLFSMARTVEREDKFKWVGPIFSSTHVLVAKSSRDFSVEKLEQLFQFRAAALRNDIAEVSIRNMGFPSRNLVQVADLKQAYFMLRSDRVDMMVVSVHGLSHILNKYQESMDKYQLIWQINRVDNYFAFHRDTPEPLIQAFQQAFDAIEEERNEIKRQYNLPAEEF